MNPILDPERGRVQITDIKAMQLQKHPLSLIKIETDVGLVGYGEASTHGLIVHAHLEKEILPLLKGQDPPGGRVAALRANVIPFWSTTRWMRSTPISFLMVVLLAAGVSLNWRSFFTCLWLPQYRFSDSPHGPGTGFRGYGSRIGQGVFIEEMGQHDLNVVDGYIQVPDRPGQGVELVEEVLQANLAQGEPYWN